MISSYGKIFLKKYNKVNNTDLTPKEFFIDKLVPVFFGARSFMHVQNSTFSNAAYSKKNVDEKLELFMVKINNGDTDASMLVGGASSSLIDSTSFNLGFDYQKPINNDEIYLSWIGQGLSINFSSGINFLINNEDILYDVYLGWKRYGELLYDPLYIKYKDKQISTWNAHWLNNKYDAYGSNKFNPFEEYKEKLKSINWIKLLFNLSKKYPETILNAYAYKLGQTNETFNTFVIETKKIGGYLKFCQDYFGENEYLTHSSLYETFLGDAYGFYNICKFGSIGMIALKPKLFRLEEKSHKTETDVKYIKKTFTSFQKNKELFNIYKTYIMTTLNFKDIESDIIGFAELLYNIQQKTRKNSHILIQDIIETKSLTSFLKIFSEITIFCINENLHDFDDELNKFMSFILTHEKRVGDVMLFIKAQYYMIILNNNKKL